MAASQIPKQSNSLPERSSLGALVMRILDKLRRSLVRASSQPETWTSHEKWLHATRKKARQLSPEARRKHESCCRASGRDLFADDLGGCELGCATVPLMASLLSLIQISCLVGSDDCVQEAQSLVYIKVQQAACPCFAECHRGPCCWNPVSFFWNGPPWLPGVTAYCSS